MKLTSKQLAHTLINACDGRSDQEIGKAVKEFVKLLAEYNLIDTWRDIEREVHAAWKEKYGVSNVSVLSAHALSEEAKKSLSDATRGASLTERVDERLIGGSVLRIDDTRIDGSIMGHLQRLKRDLQASS